MEEVNLQAYLFEALLTPGNFLPEKDVPKDVAQLSLQAAPSPKFSNGSYPRVLLYDGY